MSKLKRLTLRAGKNAAGLFDHDLGQYCLYSEAHALEVENEALKARVAELEAEVKQKDAIIEHSEARIANLIRLIDASEVAIQERAARISELQIALETAMAEVEKLRVIELPEITDEIWNRWVFPSLRLLGFNENDECEWTRDAVDFVALLNEGRKV